MLIQSAPWHTLYSEKLEVEELDWTLNAEQGRIIAHIYTFKNWFISMWFSYFIKNKKKIKEEHLTIISKAPTSLSFLLNQGIFMT